MKQIIKTMNQNLQSTKSKWSAKVLDKKIQIARYLTNKSEQVSPINKKLILILFAIAVASFCTSLMIQPFMQINDGTDNAVINRNDKIPTPIVRQPTASLITKEEYEMLLAYKKTMDSLKLAQPIVYQQLIINRQGLLDSLNFLINLYHK